ncbi:TIM barrel protein [Mesorhizobium sp. CAU 1732]|uniref:sugar phosphate isomerase/epimerase family protein n=1 Tax=Mesorhizobium sp. CAU 1732 TaxID=3140358 RepID=UPI003260F4D4
MPMLSLAHFTIIKAGPLELVEFAARAGFDAVGLRIQPPMAAEAIVPVVGDPQMQRAIKARLRDTGLTLLDVEAFWLMADTDMDAFMAGIETGAELGARHVLVVGNDPDRPRLLDRFARFCDHAKDCGIVPMLEFIPYSQIRSLAEAHAFLVEAGTPDAGLLVDSLHLSRSGGSPAEIAGYDPALFRYAHLCDAPGPIPPADQLRHEARNERLYPGEGGLWLEDFVAAFPAGTPFAIEAPAARHAALGMAEQAALAARMSRDVIERAGRS